MGGGLTVQNRKIIISVAAIFIAGIAVLLINAYLSGVEEKAVTQAEEQRLVRIVVATQPLEFGAPLTPENVRLQNFPASSVPEGAFRDIKQALANGRDHEVRVESEFTVGDGDDPGPAA